MNNNIITLSKYLINYEDITEELKQGLEELQINNGGIQNITINENVAKGIQNILDKLQSNIDLQTLINNEQQILNVLQNIIELKGDFRIDGQFLNIPAIQQDYTIVFKYNTDIYITGINFSLSGWKKEDRWSMKIDNNIIFNNLTIKEVGDKKCFTTVKKVISNTDINIILHNNSGNSRQIWCDLAYINK